MSGLKAVVEQQVERAWYGGARWSLALKPLIPLYKHAALKAKVTGQIAAQNNPLGIPVVVVGNITAGGTGKSPVVIKLAKDLKARGFRPGILSRGYAAKSDTESRLAKAEDSAEDVGDEPLMMARSLLDVPVIIDRDRPRGANFLKANCDVNLVICDDGLQHYALARDVEIAVLDASRGIGNGQLIPVGPLREPVERLQTVHQVLCNGSKTNLPAELQTQIDYEFELQPVSWRNLATAEIRAIENTPFSGEVIAVSGIGNPGRFHRTLEGLGLQPKPMIFPDHHKFSDKDFQLKPSDRDLPLVMTSKDAVKCAGLVEKMGVQAIWWVLEVEAQLPAQFVDALVSQLSQAVTDVKEHKREID